jgi:AcrR family transcriptional regulator
MTDQSVTKTRTRRPEARPAEILAAALDLFCERGFAATRLDDVARRAGLSKGAIYLYFPDKTSILKAIVEHNISANLATVAGLAAAHQGPVAPLLAEVLAFMAGKLGQSRLPDLIKLIISESRGHPEIGTFYLDTVINQGLPLIRSLFARGMATGEFITTDSDLAAKGFMGPMLLGAIWRSVFEPLGAEKLDFAALARTHAQIYLKGLSP